MLRDALTIGLVGVAALSSALVLLTGEPWPLLSCGVALPLSTALASLASAE